jgi:hypothetical protein
MKHEFEIPDHMHVLSIESSVTKGGQLHWRVWLRLNQLGQIKGAEDFDLQAAVNKAVVLLTKARRAAPVPKPAIKLNLSALRLPLSSQLSKE